MNELAQRRRPWFWIGFALTFGTMLVLYKALFYSGHALHVVPLWRYYLLELNQLPGFNQTAGPTSDNWVTLVKTAFFHIGASLVSGCLCWLTARIIRRGRGSAK